MGTSGTLRRTFEARSGPGVRPAPQRKRLPRDLGRAKVGPSAAPFEQKQTADAARSCRQRAPVLETYQGRIDDAVWAECRALRSNDIPVKEIARVLRCGRSVVYGALANNIMPSQRCPRRSKRRATHLGKRRALLRRLATKSTKIIAKKTLKRRGRPRKDGRARETYVVEKVILKAAFPSPAALARELGRRGLPISLSTARRDLLAMGFSAYRRFYVQALSDLDMEHRLSFCRRVLRQSSDYFSRILFSDEKWFDSNDHGCAYEWRRRGDKRRYRERVQCPAKVLVWGVIGVGWRFLKVLDIQLANGGVTSDVYRESCLRELKGVKEIRGRRLQQDGALVHWTPPNRHYIKNQLKLPTLDGWPAHSPDLNPIEHMWSIVQRSVSARGPWAVDELRKYVSEEWNKVPVSVVDSLVLSFKKRCGECVAVRGGHVENQCVASQ